MSLKMFLLWKLNKNFEHNYKKMTELRIGSFKNCNADKIKFVN